MKTEERLFNIFLGISIISWGVAGFFSAYSSEGLSLVRILTTAFNTVIGILIVLRKPVEQSGSVRSIVYSIPSLVISGLLFRLSAPFHTWVLGAEILFSIGTLIAILSFLSLGQNFAILPQLRSITSQGLYKLVRHPAYLGETLMLLACLLSHFQLLNMGAYAIFVPFLVLRILAEEKVLSEDAAYLQYKTSVKWRLIPFVW